ncbi:MAG: pyruvate kinase, partial [Gammaproteobacteria bacterium]
GGGLSAAALTEKDKEDILTIAKIDADYVAVSFPRTADDIHEARRLLNEAGCNAGIVAKIERAEALDVIEEIIQASDAIMVARGDLGVEIGDANLPPVQKWLIKLARSMNRIVITATQMMESMIENPIPTRAEVFDVANAVVDGTDAIMLSAETAAGKYPIKAIAAMDRVCLETEKQPSVRISDHRVDIQFQHIDESIAMSAMYLANHTKIAAIAALTESGSTPLWMSRISSGIPIFAFTRHEKTCFKTTLYRGVFPVFFENDSPDHATVNRAIVDVLKRRKQVKNGDKIIITKGDLTGVAGGTNALKVIVIGEGLIS